MRPVPTSFHLGPLVLHTYGLGLAVAAYIAFLYGERRWIARGLSKIHFGAFAATMIVLGVIGARIAHVATNWSHYSHHLGDTVALWQGGLASFGGIALAAPVGYLLVRRWWPDVPVLTMADAVIPALVAGWALGRLLGPQFMWQGGGHLTHQWFGLRYAGQVGKRVPVPLIQALEDGALWLSLIVLERRTTWRDLRGSITATALIVWGVVRSIDERLLLGQQGHAGSVGVQLAGVALAILGVIIGARVAVRARASGKLTT